MYFYYSKKSRKKIIHTIDCFHICNIDINDIGWFESLDAAYIEGYSLCKNCNPLYRQFQKENKNIMNFCHENGVSVHLGSKNITVKTPFSKWLITLSYNGAKFVLYHRNTWEPKEDIKCRFIGYHPQHDAESNDIIGFLQYISAHDCFRLSNPVYAYQAKPQAHKGTKRYKKEQQKISAKNRRKAIRNVLDIIDSLQLDSVTEQFAV